jgi:hypothetical protein
MPALLVVHSVRVPREKIGIIGTLYSILNSAILLLDYPIYTGRRRLDLCGAMRHRSLPRPVYTCNFGHKERARLGANWRLILSPALD